MRILIIGASGQLGQEFAKLKTAHNITPLTHQEIEVADRKRVKAVLAELEPEAVINLASFNRVDDAEDDAEKAFQVNAIGARNVAVAARELDSAVVFISTDYVYGGERDRREPYLESDPPAPLNVYGTSKLAGEYMTAQGNPRHWIIRTSGLYGVVTSRKGWTFPEAIINKARQGEPLKVVNDQVLTPTYTKDLAEAIIRVMEQGAPGAYHVTSGGECSWYEFAKTALQMAGIDAQIKAVSSSEYPCKAERPAYSVLQSQRMKPQGIEPMRHWKDALREYLKEKGIIS